MAAHIPQPSQAIGLTLISSVIASNLHFSLHILQLVHFVLSITATFEPLNSCVLITSGCNSMWRSGASTSQSARTAFFAKTANEAVIVVLPVPPLPLKIVNCFILQQASLFRWKASEIFLSIRAFLGWTGHLLNKVRLFFFSREFPVIWGCFLLCNMCKLFCRLYLHG